MKKKSHPKLKLTFTFILQAQNILTFKKVNLILLQNGNPVKKTDQSGKVGSSLQFCIV